MNLRRLFNLKLMIHMEPGKPVWKAYQEWADKIHQRTKNAVKIDISRSHYVGEEEWEMVLTGKSDIVRVFTLNNDRFPMHIIPALPFIIPAKNSDYIKILNILFSRFLFKEWGGVKVLWLGFMSPYHIHTAKKPVRTLNDLRHMKIQAHGLVADLINTWGGIAIPLFPYSGTTRESHQQEIIRALKNGEIDGVMATFELVRDFQLHEVTKYHTYLYAVRDVNATVMSQKTWDQLPDEIKNIFEDLKPWSEILLDKAQNDESKEAENILIEHGHEMVQLDFNEHRRWVDASQPLINREIKRLQQSGIPAVEMIDEIHRLL